MNIFRSVILIIGLSSCNAKRCCSGANNVSASDGRCTRNESIDFKCDGARIYLNFTDLDEIGLTDLHNGSLSSLDGAIFHYCETTILTQHGSYDGLVMCYISDQIFEENKIKVVAILGYCSLLFIISTIVIYGLIPILHDLQGTCIIQSLVGQAVGHTFLGFLQLMNLDQPICESFALIMYTAFIYMFFWLAIHSFHIWKNTVEPEYLSAIKRWKLIYFCFAIGGTSILLIVLLLSHYSDWVIFDDIKPRIGETSCWFITIRETFIYFYGPISVLLIVNVIFYAWTIKVLSHRVMNTRSKVLKYRLKICVRLCIIMGITWVFEIITALIKNRVQFIGNVLIYILDILNVLQGFLIFIVLVVFRKKVRRALANKNPCDITFPRSWRNLEDEEIEYENTTVPVVRYTQT